VGGGREACVVGGDVVNGVGRHGGRVEDDVGYEGAVEEGLDAEVEVGRRASDRGARIDVGVAGMDDRRVVAVDLDGGRSVGGRGSGAVLRYGSWKGRRGARAWLSRGRGLVGVGLPWAGIFAMVCFLCAKEYTSGDDHQAQYSGRSRVGRFEGTRKARRSWPGRTTARQQTPEALGAFHKAEIEKWWSIIEAANIKAE
jgi:hypothetical protein